jgi:cell division protein FtsI (penicillin-binding protein 3)
MAHPPRTRRVAALHARRRILLGSLGLAALLVVGRGVHLQAYEGEKWRAAAAKQHQGRVPVPARRGGIFDRDGVPLALSYETFRISVAPGELEKHRPAAVAALREVLGLSAAAARRATDPKLRWVVLPGRFTAEQREKLRGIRGIHFERKLERFYPQGDVGREVLGVVSGDGRPLGGVEQEMDEVLRGSDGFSVLLRDAEGELQPSASLPGVPPRDGADVYLSIDFDLQEIADQALREAVRRTGAAGGDLVITDPKTGEVLASVSRRPSAGRTLAAVTEPYEPGSTLKPLFLASLLAEGRVSLAETVHAENGSWTDPNGRTFTDSHRAGALTVRDALRESSNIVMAKLSARFRPGEQYRYLRDFGLGTPTGVEYPSEAAGRLRAPAEWSRLTPASLAIGYEVAVTPLQLLMAYGALANGGVLMEPRLLRAVRAPDGGTIREWEPRALRRVVPAEVTEALREVLVSVVEEGTATRASLSTFDVAGKTGTARLTGASGRYEAGAYASTFVGFFPARDPQLALFVKLDRPQGDYYGGLTAAPVTRETLQAILAARSPALDGASLLATRRSAAPARPSRAGADALASGGREAPYVFDLAEGRPRSVAPRPSAPVPVPGLAGLPLRDAARRAHAVGLHVRVRGAGRVRETLPAAGSALAAGDTVTLVGAEP